MSFFKSDLANENLLSQFLDEQYKKNKKEFKRINDLDLQHRGIDLIFYNEEIPYKVDEKAQLHYLNTSLPTFALEIDYLKNGKLKNGWLYDTGKLTEYYSFVFSIYLKEGKIKLENVSDFESVEIVMVSRLRLILELERMEITYSVCKKISESLREGKGEVKISHESGFNFQISKKLSEEPVNLVIKKSFLERIGNKLN